jgi:hypothetical protein
VIKVEQAYRYGRASTYDPARAHLDLATSGGRTARGPALRPRFFSGFFTQPQVAAEAVRALARVAASRYQDLPTPTTSRDPVVTCDGEGLRFEAFSACGGVYARADVLAAGLDGEVFERGTTNVDVGEPLRRLLAGVRGDGVLHVAVGSDEVVFTEPERAVVERRVPLPARWLRGFAESQQIASTFEPRLEVPAADAARFLRTASGPRDVGWVLPAGRGLRLSGRASAQAAYLSSGRRLESMLPLLRFASRMRAYGPAATPELDSAPSAWELELPGLRFTVLLSPASNRGLSGEGSVLDALATDDVTGDADAVHAELSFQPRLDLDALASATGRPAARVRGALTGLAVSGRVGYDLSAASYFHRELPYDVAALEALNPRLRAARALVAGSAVRLSGPALAEVSSSERTYRVRSAAAGDTSCTCTWWTSHRGQRGPCKHVLAVAIVRRRAATDGEAIEDDGSADVGRDAGADRTG